MISAKILKEWINKLDEDMEIILEKRYDIAATDLFLSVVGPNGKDIIPIYIDTVYENQISTD